MKEGVFREVSKNPKNHNQVVVSKILYFHHVAPWGNDPI